MSSESFGTRRPGLVRMQSRTACCPESYFSATESLSTLKAAGTLGEPVDAGTLDAEIEDVTGSPEHTEGGVLAPVCGVSGTDGLVGFFYLTLLTQVEYIFNCHL